MVSLRLTLSVILAATLAAGCAADNASAEPDDDEVGAESPEMIAKLAQKYGGEHVGLTLSPSGGELDFDCAGGSLSAPFKVDARGRFSLPGTFVRHTGVRPPAGYSPKVESVQFKGTVTGAQMKLRFTTDAGQESFTLTANADGRIYRCM